MSRELEHRIDDLRDELAELRDELAEFRAWVIDPDPDAPYDDGAGTALDRSALDAAGEPTVTTPDDDGPELDPTDLDAIDVSRSGGGWRTVTNTVTGEERTVQGHEAEAEAIRELTS